MKLGRWAYPSTVTVERYAGQGPYGPSYDDAATVRCNVETVRRLVRDVDGREAVSETTLTIGPDVAELPAESRVTVDGTITTVITAGISDAPLGGIRQWKVALK